MNYQKLCDHAASLQENRKKIMSSIAAKTALKFIGKELIISDRNTLSIK